MVAAATVATVATGGSRRSKPRLRTRLPAALQPSVSNVSSRSSEHSRAMPQNHRVELPHLSLEGPIEGRPKMKLHNVALIRLIYEEARLKHTARPEYQARQTDPTSDEPMHGVIFREACSDILSATRVCCKAYRAVEIMDEASWQRREARRQKLLRTLPWRRLRSKLLVTGVFFKMLQNTRENNDKAELMWKECCKGLASLSVSSKAFAASKSLGLRSLRVCGNISLSLRKVRRSTSSKQKSDDNRS